jgi:hypothetical protein
MSPTELFNTLGAPLTNNRWSWGAVRQDGIVLLRVWDDEKMNLSDHKYVRITAYEYFRNKSGDLGWNERLKHLELIKDGAQAYMVICFAVDVNAAPRKISTYSKQMLWKAGKWIEHEGDVWLEIVSTVPINVLTMVK